MRNLIEQLEKPYNANNRDVIRGTLEVRRAQLAPFVREVIAKRRLGELGPTELNDVWIPMAQELRAINMALEWHYNGERRWRISYRYERSHCEVCDDPVLDKLAIGIVQEWHDGQWYDIEDWKGHEDCVTDAIEEYCNEAE